MGDPRSLPGLTVPLPIEVLSQLCLTMKEVDDGSQVGSLLDRVATSVASFTADGVYDQDSMSAAAAERHPEAAITVPPRSTAVPSETAETAPPVPF